MGRREKSKSLYIQNKKIHLKLVHAVKNNLAVILYLLKLFSQADAQRTT